MKHFAINHATLMIILLVIFSAWSAAGAEKQPVDDPAEFEGLIEPYDLVKVGTPVEGVVDKVNVERSAFVKKGDPLLHLESSVERAIAERAHTLSEVAGEIQLQKEQLAFARRMFKRIDELFKSEAISADKRDQAATEVRIARARLKKAEENRRLAQLDYERTRAMLDRRTIKSPISGIVVERFVSPGEFVDNQPLLKLAQMDPLKVEVILPAAMFAEIKPGMMARIIPETHANENYTATISIVDRVIDPASGTFGVRLELPNPDYRLPGGLKCSVHFVDQVKTASSEKTTDTMEAGKVAQVTQPAMNLTAVAR